ncbi:Rieske 2Fe-2S domain-containing protein [Prescottella equi]|uniref:Rieske 2Fe-2S domain-containing protein n=1 Tax=Rhodococcus hoagii TaxID=43767 RepID=UPI0009BD3909|nr:Rieske 2Fe-2S domain-containing protein [Prescottella equi]MBP0082640.1 3-ketosteroid-9-alpha-hydroxylase [Prescottella equi]MBP0087128.1 3-ketosteroid-9-alpha-hydroxylase [Prescottella equi]MBP0095811.1 3-ketosteroid-9-alpha-hydroxylase [Prescottella equi]MBP0101814.1 3-ketosteroid-9-alpha-hydroxylase [Prescottella equi]OQQ30460.1 3-ketosteroid-9-alpha-hydroxylase [Prescottella equi]
MTLNQSDETEVREIVAGVAPTRFARGWHCLGLSESFKDGKPHSVHAFGTKLVVFADSKGDVQVLDAYCRHMGGDLSQGEIKGDSVACPFHDWRWNGKGRCTDIPYARRVPPVAKTRAWPTLDQDGMLFIWHDPEGKAPTEEDMYIPHIEGALSDEWTEWVWYTTEVDTNCREIVDNVVDMAHFFYVHYSFPTFFKNVFEGPVASQFMRGEARTDMRPHATGVPKMLGSRSDASYFGPSFMIDDLAYEYEGYDVESILINCHYPVSPDKFVLMYGMIVKKSPVLGDKALETAQKFGEFIAKGFEQDIAIWKNKTRIENPLLCEEDGPVYQLRRWYEQFYVDRADVTSDMTDRFEHEMDTTKAVASWRRVVEDNLEKKARENAAAGV